MIHYEIPRRSKNCALNEEHFEEGMHYYSSLNKEQRKDFCEKCWEVVSPEEKHVFWKAQIPMKKHEGEKSKRRDEVALQLIKNQELKDEESFVLALLLSRNKLLKLRQEVDNTLIYEVVDTEEMLAIPKAELSSIQTEEVQKKLAEKLSVL